VKVYLHFLFIHSAINYAIVHIRRIKDCLLRVLISKEFDIGQHIRTIIS
jgi:hypothetical protein